MAFPFSLDPFMDLQLQEDLFHGGNEDHGSSTPTSSGLRSRTVSQSSSHRATPTDTPKGSISRGNSAPAPALTYHAKTGVFQASEVTISAPGGKPVSTKNKTQKKGTFSSMSSSMNRPRGSVFKRALFSVGIPTKGKLGNYFCKVYYNMDMTCQFKVRDRKSLL